MKKGAKLEMLINMTNNEYRNAGIADIDKVPPPVEISKVSGKKVSGFLDRPRWVDYNGIYRGRAIIFDAKESTVERFTLANLEEHQYKKLKMWHEHGAVSFLIVAFWLKGKNEPEIYYLKFEQLAAYWEKKDSGGSKSIPISYFREHCVRVKGGNGFTVHYLYAAGLQD